MIDSLVPDAHFQVKSYVNKVEASSSSAAATNNSRYPKVIGAKPFKRPSLSQMPAVAAAPAPSSTGSTASSEDLSSTADILAASRRPSANARSNGNLHEANNNSLSPTSSKPQFYFGQNGHDNDVVGSSSAASRSKQTAIDKVKKNEAVSHPKNILINPGYRIKDYVDPTEKSGKPSYAFGETPVVRKASAASSAVELAAKHSNAGKPAVPSKPAALRNQSPEPMIEPVVRNYSKFAPPTSTETAGEFKVPRPNLKPTSSSSSSAASQKKRSGVEDGLSAAQRAAFEAELANGRARLKKVSNGQYDSVDGGNVSSAAPPPPPPMPFNTSSVTTPSGNVIPPAPRLPLPPVPPPAPTSGGAANLPTTVKKVVNASRIMTPNPRDELMSAIRGAGGVNGLRKVIIIHLKYISFLSIRRNSSFCFQTSGKNL